PRPGTGVTLQGWGRGQVPGLTATVDGLEPEVTARAGGPGQGGPQPPAQPVMNELGLAVADVPADRLAQLRIKGGALVQGVEGAAARAGLRAGDIVLAVNNTEVSDSAQFNELVKGLDRSRTVVLLVRRGDNAQFVPIRPE